MGLNQNNQMKTLLDSEVDAAKLDIIDSATVLRTCLKSIFSEIHYGIACMRIRPIFIKIRRKST